LSEVKRQVKVTREGILDDAFMAKVYAQLPADARLLTPEELESSVEAILSMREGDAPVFVFGYGSLMWNPALDHASSRPAKVPMCGIAAFACARSSGAVRRSGPA